MKITEEYIEKVIKKGNWMIRADNNGISYNGFKWNPIGKWTTAPDWNEISECGGGLHGQDVNHGGYISGTRLVFCETKGKHIPKGNNKMKVKSARILLLGIPYIPKIKGSLDLSGCTLPDNIKLPDSVGGSLYLGGCILPNNIKLPDSIGGSLYLNGCTLPNNIKLPDSVGGSLDLGGCKYKIKQIPKHLREKIVK